MLKVVLSNCSSAESKTFASTLVKEKLAACVNVIPGVSSYYMWNGEFCEDEEHTLLIKTTPERYDALKTRLVELHSYDVPEVVALDATDVLEGYLSWVSKQIR